MIRMGYLTGFLIALVDQGTKRAIEAVLDYGGVVELLPFFNIVHARNRGISFGVLNTGDPWVPWLLGGVAVGILVALGVWLHRSETRSVAIGLGLVMGGAIGNLVDRIFNSDHAVIDFLDFYIGSYHWPAFNIADSAITVGVALLLIDSLIARREEPRLRPEDTKGPVRDGRS